MSPRSISNVQHNRDQRTKKILTNDLTMHQATVCARIKERAYKALAEVLKNVIAMQRI